MMPILEQSSVSHHHHGHGHQTFFHEPSIPESTNKIQLTLILPNGVPSVLNVDTNTPMMDLLVQAASLNKLNPSSYTLVVLDADQHVIHFKPNQTVGQIGSSTISLLPKEAIHSNSSSKTKSQPFEITVRLLVNLPDAQKILLRIDPTLPLHEIKEQICKQKKYMNSNEYTLRLPNKLDQPILLGLSLAEYKTNELTLVHQKSYDSDQQLNANQLQSFDRLYRIRSESQPRKENSQQNEQLLINTKQMNHMNSTRSSSLRPSHTTLHAYWNDPNFDTQSQLSNSSSIVKKRRAPRPPGYTNSVRPESQIIYTQHEISNDIHSPPLPLRSDHHHQSHESLQSENNKKKRKAPVVAPTNGIQKKDDNDKIEQQQQQQQHQQQTNIPNHITRPGLDPPPPPSKRVHNPDEDYHSTIEVNYRSPKESSDKIDSKTNYIDDNHSTLNLSEDQTITNDKLAIQTDSLDLTNIEIHSPTSIHSPDQTNSPNSTLTNIQLQVEKKYEQKEEVSTNTFSTNINDTPIPKPPRQNVHKEKKPSSNNGLLRIVNDHNDRSNIYQKHEVKPKETNENVSYFRVAKSRYGKFETENRNFVHNAIAIFDSTNQQKSEQLLQKNSQSIEILDSKQSKTTQSNILQNQTKGKQAYSLLKKYEKEEQLKSTINVDLLKAKLQYEKPSMPIQLEVIERNNPISVSVEGDRKKFLTQVVSSTRPPSPPPLPPILAPKPFGKIITEYRTVRSIDNSNETVTRKHNGLISSTDTNQTRMSPDLAASYDALMDSIRKFGGSQNLRKN